MLENISKEIFYYSFIPVAVLSFIIMILLIVGRKKSNNYYRYNYVIKVLLAILIVFILSLMTGYTIWVFERVINLETVSQNILYLALLVIIVASLLASLILLLLKLYKEKELQN